MMYNILEIIFIALALLVMGIFAVLQSRARKKYRQELIEEFDHKESTGGKNDKDGTEVLPDETEGGGQND